MPLFPRRAALSLFPPVALSLALGCAPAYISPKPTVPEPLVRVAIRHRLPQALIEPRDTAWASDGAHASPIAPGNSWTVKARQGRLLAETGYGTSISDIGPRLTIRGGPGLTLNGTAVAWALTLSPEGDSALLAVAELPMEEYLVGVLARELGNAGEAELEALKAQAVAARGYAYVKIGTRPGAAYDLESDVSHQAFEPSNAAGQHIRKAVEETRGQVMACRGRVFPPNYHSTCGGRTAMPSEAWGTPDSLFPWARSAKDRYCSISPRHRWSQNVSAGGMAGRALGLADTTIPVADVKILERSPSGRVLRLKVASQAGDTVLYRDRIRHQLTDKALPSTWFDVECLRDGLGNVASVEFTGRGYGHGVGMCQWGAIGMAREGKRYVRILKHYYKDIDLIRLY